MEKIKFYSPDGKSKLSKEEFIQIYGKNYFLEPKLESSEIVKGIMRSSSWVENQIEDLLENGITEKEDIIHILAWKIGKIRHAESQKNERFVYASDWQNAEKFKAKLYGNELNFEAFIKYICSNIDDLKTKIDNNELQTVMNMFKEKSCPGIGTVYMITLLYFISQSKWPIYDKYAQVAVYAISKGIKPGEPIKYSELPNKNDSKFDTLMDETGAYKKYVRDLKDIFGNKYNKRDVDRALWVYGHLFDSKGKC